MAVEARVWRCLFLHRQSASIGRRVCVFFVELYPKYTLLIILFITPFFYRAAFPGPFARVNSLVRVPSVFPLDYSEQFRHTHVYTTH